MLGIVGWQWGIGSTDTALYCLLIVVYWAEIVKYCLALTRYGDVLQSWNIHFLTRSVVKSGWDSTLSLQDFGSWGGVVDEADWLDHAFLLVCHLKQLLLT